HERVAVGNEHLLDIAVGQARGPDVGQRLVERANPELLVPVHVSVRAVVPRAANRGLQDVRVGLAQWPVDRSLVPHRPLHALPRTADGSTVLQLMGPLASPVRYRSSLLERTA